MNNWEAVEKLVTKLWDSEDKDCAYAEELGFKEDIISLFVDCYTPDEAINWLAKHDFNPAWGFGNAEIYEPSNFEDPDEWESIKADSLFANDNFAVRSW